MAELAAAVADMAYGVGGKCPYGFVMTVAGVVGEYADAHSARMRECLDFGDRIWGSEEPRRDLLN
jgi:hypothetical protein